MLISKEKHYNLKDLFQVMLLSCATALFWEVCFILFSQLPNPIFDLSHPPDQDRQPSLLIHYILRLHKHISKAWCCTGVMLYRGDILLLTSPALHSALPGRPWVTPLVVSPHSGLSVVAVATWPRANHHWHPPGTHLHLSTGVQVWVNKTISVQ